MCTVAFFLFGERPVYAEDCFNNLPSTFLKATKWIAPAVCLGSTYNLRECQAAMSADSAQHRVALDAAVATMKTFRADCKLRNQRNDADHNNTDSLAAADQKTKDLARKTASTDAIAVAQSGDPRTNNSAFQRVGQIALVLGEIHQGAFGELDRNMREFVNNPSDRRSTTANVQGPAPTRSVARAGQSRPVTLDELFPPIATSTVERAPEPEPQPPAANVSPSVVETEDDELEARRLRRQARRERINAGINSEMTWNRFLISQGLTPGYSGSRSSGSGRSGQDRETFCGSRSGCN